MWNIQILDISWESRGPDADAWNVGGEGKRQRGHSRGLEPRCVKYGAAVP